MCPTPPSTQPFAAASPSPSAVWYVSYGSNMDPRRLRSYLEGGCPPGGNADHPGARDGTPPADSAGVTLPGRLYFAGRSRVWGGGGVAFYDHDVAGPTPARAFLVTAEQFADIAAQEKGRTPAPGDPVESALSDGLPGGRLVLGRGYYETVLDVGALRGLPMYTFTAAQSCDAVVHTPPSTAYLATLAAGLRQAHDWPQDRIDDYFAEHTTRSRPEDAQGL